MSIRSLVPNRVEFDSPLVLCVLSVFLVAAWTTPAQGQFIHKWLNVGELHSAYSEMGSMTAAQSNVGLQWPAQYQQQDHMKYKWLWIGAKNVKGEDGEEYPYRVVHRGPRSAGVGEMLPVEFKLVSKYPKPEVRVDGLTSFRKPVVVDTVDPDLPSERMLYQKINTVMGITVEKRIYAFSNPYHDNYHIIETTLTNTGNTDRDPEQELEQTMEGVYMSRSHRWAMDTEVMGTMIGGAGWGRNTMYDVAGTDAPQDYDVDFKASYGWHGYEPSFQKWDNIGAPNLEGGGWTGVSSADTSGRLLSADMAGRVYIHADQSAEDTTNSESQPSTISWRTAATFASDAWSKEEMQSEYTDIITRGHRTPHHADVVEPTGDFAHYPTKKNPALGTPGGNIATEAWGPYTLEPGEDVRIVVAEGVDGLSKDAAIEVGKAFKQHHLNGNPYADISFDADGDGVIESDETMDKNEWVMTARDSLFDTFRQAIANYESDYEVAHPPKPPKSFTVTSGVDQVELEWTVFEDASPNGFEIYRTRNHWQGAIESEFDYEKIYTAGPDERSFNDTEVVRGIEYYYHIRTIGDVNQDPTGSTPVGDTLKSSRFYTQTYDPASLKRSPGEELASARIVPNPLNISSSRQVRWPGNQYQVGFLDIPGNCTIQIYTEAGDLVETIEHTDGSGDEFWDLQTRSEQLIVSGIYLVRIRDNETGNEIVRKMVVVR